MSTLAFDGRTGASGDMLLAALLAAGADGGVLAPVESAMDLSFEVDRVTTAGIAATRVRITRGGEVLEGQGPHRTFADVRERVDAMDLPTTVRKGAVATFRLLGEAEARVHDTSLESAHFHEVGADDAIADVVGFALLLDDLDPDRVVTTPVAVGGGEVTMSHGTYPVPTPAVVELVSTASWKMRGGPVEQELLTPTGAAILAQVATGVEALPPMRLTTSGCGAGSRDLGDHANVVRALIGETRDLGREDLVVLETNVDDTTPEVLGGLQERLADVGALDVAVLPVTMKKSRPGHLVKVVTAPEDAHRVARRLAAETGTLGIRGTPATHRWIADRTVESVTIAIDGTNYDIDVKVATDASGTRLDVSPEFDDAAAIAAETDLPIREVMRLAESAHR